MPAGQSHSAESNLPPPSMPSRQITQREGHPGVATGRAQMEHAGGGNDNVLAALNLIRRGRRASSPRQRRGPQFLAGRLVKRANLVVACAGTKEQTADRNDRAAVILRPRSGSSFGRQLRVLAQRLFPYEFPRVQINAV